MKFGRMYGHFAAAYGTWCLVAVAVAVVSRQHIDTGLIGAFGFPIVAAIYAWMRHGFDVSVLDELRELRRAMDRLARSDERPSRNAPG